MKATNATKLAVDELSTDRDSEVTGLVGLEAGAFYGTNGANLLNTEPSSYRIDRIQRPKGSGGGSNEVSTREG